MLLFNSIPPPIRKRFRIAAEELHEQDAVGGHTLSSLVGNSSLLVSGTSRFLVETFLTDRTSIDFMSIRKIPLKQHGYISKDLSVRSVEDTEQDRDDEVESYLSRIRTNVLTDRALNDQASNSFPPASLLFHRN